MARLGHTTLQLPTAPTAVFARQTQAATPKAAVAVASQRRFSSERCVSNTMSSCSTSCSPATAGFRRVARAAQSPEERPARRRSSSSSSSFASSGSLLSAGERLTSQLMQAKHTAVMAVKGLQQDLEDAFTQVLKELTPPAQVSAGPVLPETKRLTGLCALMMGLAIVLFMCAFLAAPDLKEQQESDCQWFPGIARTLQVTLTSLLMFAAGALLALEHPVRLEMLRCV